MFETDLDSKIKSGAISTRLASTEDLSKHQSPYFEILSASTKLFSLRELVGCCHDQVRV
jgi:hypothetical protein